MSDFDLIQEGDIALFRGRSFWSKLIAYGTGGPYSHVGILDKDKYNVPYLLDVIEGTGGREIPFVEEVERYPKSWDVFRLDNPNYIPHEATSWMRTLVGKPYGKWGLTRVAVRYVPIIRWCLPVHTNDAETTSAKPFCSHAVADAVACSKIDMVKNLPNHFVTPNHISWCPYLEKVATF